MDREEFKDNLDIINLLGGVAQRLHSVEQELSQKQENPKKSNTLLEIIKLVFGSWPAFGIIFLVLFYSPIIEVLETFPEKVKSANEIKLGNFSLKETIQSVAQDEGFEDLANVIPELSNGAIELLLKAPRHYESIISYTNSYDNGGYSHLNFPNDKTTMALAELESKGLVNLSGSLSGQSRDMTGDEILKLSKDIKRQYPGSADPKYNFDDSELQWKLDNEIKTPTSNVPNMGWQLSEDGSNSVSIVLKAIAKQFSND